MAAGEVIKDATGSAAGEVEEERAVKISAQNSIVRRRIDILAGDAGWRRPDIGVLGAAGNDSRRRRPLDARLSICLLTWAQFMHETFNQNIQNREMRRSRHSAVFVSYLGHCSSDEEPSPRETRSTF